MTALLYDLIYIISVLTTAACFYCGLSGNETITPLACAAILIPVAFLSLLTHLKLKGRLLLLGITAAGFTGILIVYRRFADQASPADLRQILPLLAISLACYASGILMARYTIARLSASFISLILLILTVNAFIHPLTPGIFSAMFLIIISTADEVQQHWKKDGFTDKKTHLVCTAPFIALIIITASLFDYPDNPYDWRAFITIRDSVVRAADRIAYSFGKGSDVITGFSDDGYLLTGLGSSVREELIITTRSDTDAPIYLTGTVSDTFDGRGWTNKDDSGIPERAFDVLESISSVKSYSDLLRDYYREADISVEYTELKTRYLLAPSKLTSKSDLNGRASVDEEGGAFTFRRYNPYHLSLNESYLISNTDNPAFHAYMQSNAAPGEKEWNEALNMIKKDSRDKELSYEKYPEYLAWIKSTYSEDIHLSPELKEKTDALYAGAQSSYEKLRRLESALGKMEYTLDPPPIPDDVDTPSEYLDHFLLEEGGGYCSYYATAFALLARAEGLPSRYVQGYRVPADKKGA